MDWITGEKFLSIADYIYAPNVRASDDYIGLVNTLYWNKLKDGDIIYTHTMYVKHLFKEMRMYEVLIGKPPKIIVISHNSDVNVDDSFSVPDCVIKWFSQNVNVFHEKIEALPIGLENSMWFPDMHKKEKMIAKLKEPRIYKNLVYMNHNIATNPAKRTEVYNLLKDKPWVTTDMRTNGQDFDSYLDNIYNHKFVICPEGNGIDTHRVWECLYMGTIPVVVGNATSEYLYSYLPCCIIPEGWNSLDEIYLKICYREISGIASYYSVANLLTFEHWKNKILSYKQ